MSPIVLVTGGAGLIGSHLVDGLLERGLGVRVLDSLEAYSHPDGKPAWMPSGAEFIRGNILDETALGRALAGVEVVFHQAALTGFSTASPDYVAVNASGTARIFDVIHEKRLEIRKIVTASSLSVYGEGSYLCPEHGELCPPMRSMAQMQRREWEPRCPSCGLPLKWQATAETGAREPFTPYAISKYAGELLALSQGARLGIPVTALRYAVTYGPRQSVHNAYSTVITTFAALLMNDRPPVLYEDGEQRRDWTCVDDIVQANLLAMDDERADGRVFNVGTGKAASVRQVAEALAGKLGKSIEPACRGGEFRPGDIRNLVLDIGRIESLGFRPRFDLEAGLDRFLEWFRGLGKVKERYTKLEARMRETGELLA